MSAPSALPTFRIVLRPLRLLPSALIALVLGAALAACGGGQGGGNATLPVLSDLETVANTTANADSARFEMQFDMEMPVLGSTFGFSASGAYDTPSKQAHITMDLGSFAEFMNGLAGSVGGEAPDGLADPSKWKLELRLDGTVAYMQLPFMASELPAGKEWVKVDLEAAAREEGFDLGQLQSFAQGSDPRQTLDYLRAISGKLTRLGTEEVRGVPSTHYFAVVDWQKALAKAARDAGQPGLFNELLGTAGTLQNVPVDVWVDADNLVRRMTMDFSFSTQGEQLKASMSMELFDYGASVSVETPAAADVVDVFELRG